MIDVYPEFIVDESQKKKAVVITIEEWKKIVEKLEELEDIEAYDKEKTNMSEVISFEEALKEIEQGKVR